MHTSFASSLRNTNGEFYLTLTCLTYIIDAGNLDFLLKYLASLYLYRVAKYLWLHMFFQLKDIAYNVVNRKRPTHSVEYVV